MTETELRVTVVDADLAATRGMWGDSSGGWRPSASEWVGRLAALGVPYEVCASLREPVRGLVVDPAGNGTHLAAGPILVGPPPATGEETLQVLATNLGAIVVPDLRGVLVLRLDDPGAAVKEHLTSWAHPPLDADGWEALWQAVAGLGRASVFCCPGYVLADGTVVDSRKRLPEEWAGLDEGVARGLADLECHGYTHMHPDTSAWSAADDRHSDVAWFREMRPPRLPGEPSVDAQLERLRSWQSGTGKVGTAMVAPGEAWDLNTLAAARLCGFALFNSWEICFLDREVPTWSYGVGSPYIDQSDPAWFADCIPQIGYWHDRDMVLGGPSWVGEQLAAWRDCGAKRALSFADLAATYAPIDAALLDGEVVVRSAPDVPLRIMRG